MDKVKIFAKYLGYGLIVSIVGFLLWYMIAYIILAVRLSDFFFKILDIIKL